MVDVDTAMAQDMGYEKDSLAQVQRNSAIGCQIMKHLQDYNRMLLDIADAQRNQRDVETYRGMMQSVNTCIKVVRVFDASVTDIIATVEKAIN